MAARASAPPPTKNNTRNCYRGIHLVIGGGAGRGCLSDHDLKSGQICAAEKMKLDVVSDPSRSGTDRNRAGMREVHGGASTVAAHARGGGGARLSQ